MIRHQLFIGFALIVGVAAGYFVRERSEGTPAATAEVHTQKRDAKGRIADDGDAASVRALRRRVAELERQLAEAQRNAAASNSETAVAVNPDSQPRGPRGNPREWLENLKKSDPARYAQMTNRFANWRRQRAERALSTIDFLSSIDTSRMSAAAKKTHAALQDMIARREEIEQRLHQEGITDEERGQLFSELRGMHGEMERLRHDERRNLIAETAKELGFKGEDVKTITATIQEVIEATSGGFGGRRGGPPPPPR